MMNDFVTEFILFLIVPDDDGLQSPYVACLRSPLRRSFRRAFARYSRHICCGSDRFVVTSLRKLYRSPIKQCTAAPSPSSKLQLDARQPPSVRKPSAAVGRLSAGDRPIGAAAALTSRCWWPIGGRAPGAISPEGVSGRRAAVAAERSWRWPDAWAARLSWCGSFLEVSFANEAFFVGSLV